MPVSEYRAEVLLVNGTDFLLQTSGSTDDRIDYESFDRLWVETFTGSGGTPSGTIVKAGTLATLSGSISSISGTIVKAAAIVLTGAISSLVGTITKVKMKMRGFIVTVIAPVAAVLGIIAPAANVSGETSPEAAVKEDY